MDYELLFSGKNEVSLNFTYREYSHEFLPAGHVSYPGGGGFTYHEEADLARPAFYQNLTYQPDAKQIRFKGFVIQIHDVTNEKITYTVVEDGLGG